MHEVERSRAATIAVLRADMPPATSVDDMCGARARVLSSPSRRHAWAAPRRAWRVAGGLAVVAAVIALAVSALGPGQQGTAFARERAAAALQFQVPGKILHAEMSFITMEQGFPEGENHNLEQRWSLWADPDGNRMRQTFVNNADGSLDELFVEVDGRSLAYLSTARYPKQQLISGDTSKRPIWTILDDTVGSMREGIATGRVKVAGTQTMDGAAYWVLTETSDDGETVETLTMRKTDYRPRTWERTTTTWVDRRTEVLTKRVVFNTIEQVEPPSLPNDFFSLDAVKAAVTPGMPAEKH